MLVGHSRAEEAEVYPVAAAEAGEADDVAHSQEEHIQAEQLLEQLAGADPESPAFEQVLKELVDAVTHHVEEESRKRSPRCYPACETASTRTASLSSAKLSIVVMDPVTRLGFLFHPGLLPAVIDLSLYWRPLLTRLP